MSDTVATLIGEVREMRLANEELKLRLIEASNPGIDMERVRQQRAGGR